MFKILVFTVLLCTIGTSLGRMPRPRPTESPSNSTSPAAEGEETTAETTEESAPSPTDMETADICDGSYNDFKHVMIFLSANFLKRVHNTNPQTSVVTSALFPGLYALAVLGNKEKYRNFKVHNEQIKCIRDAIMSLLKDTSESEELYAAINVGLDVKFTATEEFKDKLLSYAFGEVISVNATDSEDAAAQMNDMLEGQTENHITDVISPESISKATPFVLAGGVYFKADFAVGFNERAQGKFYVTPCKTVEATYLRRRLAIRHTISAAIGASVIELDYVSPNWKLLLILPDVGVTPYNILRKIRDYKVFNQLLDSLVLTDVAVSIPYFDVTFTTDLVDVLTKTNTVPYLVDPTSNKVKDVIVGNVSLGLSVANLSVKTILSPDGGEPISDEMPTLQAKFYCDRPFIAYVMVGGIPSIVKVIANKQ